VPLDGSPADGAARLVSRVGTEAQPGADDLAEPSAGLTGQGPAGPPEPFRDAVARAESVGRPAEPPGLVADGRGAGGTLRAAPGVRETAQYPQARSPRTTARGLAGLDADDRAALGLWVAAHLALLALAWAAAWAYRTSVDHAPLTGGFEHWDAVLLRNVAQYGYFGVHSTANNVAFFPGYPITLAAAHLILRNWVLSELAVSCVAGCFAVVSLARLANGRRVVLYLLTTPAAIFLMVGYTEALFLALAIPAWHAATRGRWWRAAALAGLSGLVRPDALFLIPALVVLALVQPGSSAGSREPSRAAASRLASAAIMGCAFAGPAAYEIYLKITTGSWLAWSRAMQTGWDLHLTDPVQTLKTTWWAAFKHAFGAGTAFEFQLELGAMAVIVLAAVAFAVSQHWPEAVYCGLAAVALGTSTWYQGCPRTLLVLFPVFVALAGLGSRRPWINYVYLGVSAPLAVVLGMMFLSGQWAG
jgi:hypothetical protein